MIVIAAEEVIDAVSNEILLDVDVTDADVVAVDDCVVVVGIVVATKLKCILYQRLRIIFVVM